MPIFSCFTGDLDDFHGSVRALTNRIVRLETKRVTEVERRIIEMDRRIKELEKTVTGQYQRIRNVEGNVKSSVIDLDSEDDQAMTRKDCDEETGVGNEVGGKAGDRAHRAV